MKKELLLADAQIQIRPCRIDDAEAICEAVIESVAELSLWTPWCPADYGMAHCRPWLESRTEAWATGLEYDCVILDAQTGQLCGGCALNQINHTHNFANLGYWIRTSRRGEGMAPAASRLLARFAFEQLGFTRIEIVVSQANRASRRVAEKAGATLEGIARRRHVIRDRIDDAVIYSLIPEDFDL